MPLLLRKQVIFVVISGIFFLFVVVLYNFREVGLIFRYILFPEYIYTSTFQRRLVSNKNSTDYDYLPSHCIPIAKQFDLCHDRYHHRRTTATSLPTITFGCHRRWCQSYGHCEPCSGIGDRFRFLISQIDSLYSMTTHNSIIQQVLSPDDYHPLTERYALQKTYDYDINSHCLVNIQIDSPLDGLQIIDTALYVDKYSWISELFHYRSYDVSKRLLLPYYTILQQQQQTQYKKKINSDYGVNQRPKSNSNDHKYYTHFTPNSFSINNEYDACYFHTLYKPDPILAKDIEYHRNNILLNRTIDNDISSSKIIPSKTTTWTYGLQNRHEPKSSAKVTTIGIHYRTGDAMAFHINNADVRIGVQHNHISHYKKDDSDPNDVVIEGWKKLYDCSIQLFHRMNAINNDNVRLYLATDNPIVKEYVRQHHYYSSQNVYNSTILSSSSSIPVYVTDFQPHSYLRGNSGDREALLELYLLAGCDGIVVNRIPSTLLYNGTAQPISQFAKLAKKIGFIPNSNFYECSMD